MPVVQLTCEWCKQAFECQSSPSILKRRRCCSQQCWLKIHNSPERNGNLSRKYAQRRGDVLRGTGSKHRYVKQGGQHQHRRVMERHLGRKLTSDEVIHHIDGNGKNNAIENLQLTDRREHMRIHRADLGRPKKTSTVGEIPPSIAVCGSCAVTFSLTGNQRYKWRNGTRGFYCSKKCLDNRGTQ